VREFVGLKPHANPNSNSNSNDYIQRLIFTFRDRKENEAEAFSQVIRGRANQITHILNKEKVEFANVPSVERMVDHCGFKMTESSRCYLLHRAPDCAPTELRRFP
jgi:hypothetical protein